MCENDKVRAGGEPVNAGFKFKHLTPTPHRPVVTQLLSAIYDLLFETCHLLQCLKKTKRRQEANRRSLHLNTFLSLLCDI